MKWIKNRKKYIAEVLAVILTATFVLNIFCICASAEDEITNATDIFETAAEGASYRVYEELHKNKPKAAEKIILSSDNIIGHADIKEEYEGKSGVVCLDENTHSITYKFTVKTEGKYLISADYFPIITGGTFEPNITLMIDGEYPFDEAKNIYLSKIFKNETDVIEQDKSGNDMRPRQVEAPRWIERDIIDNSGFYSEPFEFYFSEGIHTLSLGVTQEKIAFHTLTLYSEEELLSYAEKLEQYKELGYQEAIGEKIIIEAEQAFEKSHSDSYPEKNVYSPNAAINVSDPVLSKLNIICQAKAQSWLSWKVRVDVTGLYRIGARLLQNSDEKRGLFVTRKLYINGEVPFKEAEQIEIPYCTEWSNYIFGNDEEFLFYFEEGKDYTLTLECVSGRLSEPLQVVEETITELSELCREITVITGVNPDIYRDYKLNKEISNLSDRLKHAIGRLEHAVSMFANAVDDVGTSMVEIEDVLRQLRIFAEDERRIPEMISNFRVSISTLSTWTYNMTNQWIAADQLVLIPQNQEMEKATAGFFKQLWFDIKAIVASFYEDYNSIDGAEGTQSIVVWAATGRDQGNIIRTVIDDEFTPKYDISVDLSIVNSDNMTLLQATLAGKGPDVAMFVDKTLPVNLAARKLLIDLKTFDGIENILSNVYPSSVTPYEFNGGIYAVPNTQSFNLLFYRTDVFEELGIGIPKTWDEFYGVLPFIQRNNMMVGLGGDNEASNLYMFETLLMQRNGEFYNDSLTSTNLGTVEALSAFQILTEFYTDYGISLTYDFFSYFRSGIMPLAIADYTMYNMLSMAAPEIKGLWGVSQVPGFEEENGSINASVSSGGTGTVIFKSAENKDAAFSFVEWWMGNDIQKRYSFDLESIMGPGARYNSANIEAVNSLSWPKSAKEVINSQWQQVDSFAVLPSAYYITRNVNNAFRAVVHREENERETLNEYALIIDSEITRKNQELGIAQN